MIKKMSMMVVFFVVVMCSVTWANGLNYKVTMKKVQGSPDVMVVDTAIPLTHEKQVVASKKKDIESKCNDVGKTLAGKIKDIEDVSVVAVAYRQLVVRIYPFPGKWDTTKAEIDKLLVKTLK